MKKIILITLFLFLSFALFSKVNIALDLRSLDFIFERDGIRVDGEVGFSFDSFTLNIPLRFGASNTSNLFYLETGLTVLAYPVEGLGLFLEGSFIKGGFFFGSDAPEDRLYISSEGSIGYDFYIGKIYFRPRLTFRSILSSESEKALILSEIPQFREMRFSLNIGIRI